MGNPCCCCCCQKGHKKKKTLQIPTLALIRMVTRSQAGYLKSTAGRRPAAVVPAVAVCLLASHTRMSTQAIKCMEQCPPMVTTAKNVPLPLAAHSCSCRLLSRLSVLRRAGVAGAFTELIGLGRIACMCILGKVAWVDVTSRCQPHSSRTRALLTHIIRRTRVFLACAITVLPGLHHK